MSAPSFLELPTAGGPVIVSTSDIRQIVAGDGCSEIHLRDGHQPVKALATVEQLRHALSAQVVVAMRRAA